MADIFVSYNRVDSDYAVLLHAWLAETFGQERVFWDRDDIDPGGTSGWRSRKSFVSAGRSWR